MGWLTILLAIVFGPVLWLAGAIFFDLVHYVLHAMLRSRHGLLRKLAYPHAVHHQWIDRNLEIQWELRSKNVYCHIVPEYLTQLVFSAALAPILPTASIVVLVGLQTTLFFVILSTRGLDLNHRPIEMLDAYRPGFMTPPAYHALHHVYPDAYYSAYTKTIDWLVGGGAQIRGRSFVILGAESALGVALREALRREDVDDLAAIQELRNARLAETDVLILCEASDPASHIEAIETFVGATRRRRLPPEVWAVHARPDDATARHYHTDVRVDYRALIVPEADRIDPIRARAAVRTALFGIRRGFHFVPTQRALAGLAAWRRFRATAPLRPEGVPALRHRTELR